VEGYVLYIALRCFYDPTQPNAHLRSLQKNGWSAHTSEFDWVAGSQAPQPYIDTYTRIHDYLQDATKFATVQLAIATLVQQFQLLVGVALTGSEIEPYPTNPDACLTTDTQNNLQAGLLK
jgi:hypothetical protein